MKVIFLDVDGELTYETYYNSSTLDIDVEKVKMVRQICDETGAKVVISSSWRGTGDWHPSVYYTLLDILEEYGIEVVGCTPYIPPEIDPECREIVDLDGISDEYNIKFGTGRAEEVHQWILANNPEAFVILDDESWNWAEYGYDKYWIQPTYFGDGGLQPEHVEKAIKILNGGNYE